MKKENPAYKPGFKDSSFSVRGGRGYATHSNSSTNSGTYHEREKVTYKFSAESASKCRALPFWIGLLGTNVGDWYFNTFTIRAQVKEDKFYNAALGKMLENYKKQGIINNYLWRIESQKRGAWHVHLIVQGRLDARHTLPYWQSLAEQVDFSFQKFMHLDSLARAAYYVSKYVGKGVEDGYRTEFDGRCFGVSYNLNLLLSKHILFRDPLNVVSAIETRASDIVGTFVNDFCGQTIYKHTEDQTNDLGQLAFDVLTSGSKFPKDEFLARLQSTFVA